MGLHVNIYKEARQEDSWLGSIDCTMGGESSYAKGFTVVNADGPFDPCEDYPAAELVMAEPIGGKRILRLILTFGRLFRPRGVLLVSISKNGALIQNL